MSLPLFKGLLQCMLGFYRSLSNVIEMMQFGGVGGKYFWTIMNGTFSFGSRFHPFYLVMFPNKSLVSFRHLEH